MAFPAHKSSWTQLKQTKFPEDEVSWGKATFCLGEKKKKLKGPTAKSAYLLPFASWLVLGKF